MREDLFNLPMVWIYLAMVASHWRGWEPARSSAHQGRRPRRFLESHWSSAHIENPNRMSSDAENDGDRSNSSRSSGTDTCTSKKQNQGKQAAFLKASFSLATIGRCHPLWVRVFPPPSLHISESFMNIPPQVYPEMCLVVKSRSNQHNNQD